MGDRIEPPSDSVEDDWIDFEMCPEPGCCMMAWHGGGHWATNDTEPTDD